MFREWRKEVYPNSTEEDAETKESTNRTDEKLDGRCKKCHERKKPELRPVGR
jgi:hypothetical protein